MSTHPIARLWRRRRVVSAAGRGNDAGCGVVAEARFARAGRQASVLMLMPGSGLAALCGADGLPLDGDTLSGMEAPTCRRHCISWEPSLICAVAAGTGAVLSFIRRWPVCLSFGGKTRPYPEHELAPQRRHEGKSFILAHPRRQGRPAGLGNL